MYDFNFRRTLVQKPTVLTVCPGVFFFLLFPGHGYIPTIYIYLRVCVRVLEYGKTICRIVFAFFFSSPVRLKIYSSITFRVSALSLAGNAHTAVHGHSVV